MVTIILLAAAFSGVPDSIGYRAAVRPESAVFEFPVQYDTAWVIGSTEAPAGALEYEWTVATVIRDTVFSFGYLLSQPPLAGAPAGEIKFADGRAKFGQRQLFVNGSVDSTVAVDVAFEASRVVIRLSDAATIRRIFALSPGNVQFSQRVPGHNRMTLDVPVQYGEAVAREAPAPTRTQPDAELPDSIYLHLVMDLPVVGRFSYDAVSRDRRINVYSEIRNVDVKGCTLSFEIWRNFVGTTVAIPLDAIDPKSLTVRVQHPKGYSRYEPQPWLLHVAVLPDTKSRVMAGRVESKHKGASRNIDLAVKDYETGALVSGWLTDAAPRCGTWRTTPAAPVR